MVPVPAGSDFPIENIPFGVIRSPGGRCVCATRVGDHVFDLKTLEEGGLFAGVLREPLFSEPALNKFMSAGRETWKTVRQVLQKLMAGENSSFFQDRPPLHDATHPASAVEMRLPCTIGDYTDFYSSRQHATNVGIMFRGRENALMPNWLHLPVGYHGRSSSIVTSGTDIRRPMGQSKADDAPAPTFGPSKMVDFELEMGFFIGPGNELGTPIPADRAAEHIFGMVIVNDWSARDIQKWEYVPLGPFLAKNFATSISPWIVTLDALEPFRCPGPAQDPRPLDYLLGGDHHTYDIHLEVSIQTAKMTRPQVICRSNFRHLYWTMSQQLAHHTVNGCNLRPGDLLASGTISGDDPGSFGSMLELAWNRTKPITLEETGETRVSILDGDEIRMTAFCQRGNMRIGFGEVVGRVLPSAG